jgi:DNA-binding Lrp family transcriptional regulator
MKRPHTKEVIQVILATGRETVKVNDLIIKTNLTHKQILRVMDRLERDGYIKTVEMVIPPLEFGESGIRRRYPTWKLNAGKLIAVRAVTVRKKDTVRDKIWRAVRIKRKFTMPELEQFTEMKQDCLRDYVYILEAGGILKRQPNTGKIKVFVLVNDVGPERPVLPERNIKTVSRGDAENAEK